MNGRFKPGSGGPSYTFAQERGEMKPHFSSGVTEMRAKVLILALVVAIVALPVPASQLLAGRFSAAAPASAAAPEDSSLGLLLQDPFLIDQMSYARPRSFLDTATGVDPMDL
jgi:hypothetical protein